jgi:hypothetical protein
VFFSRWIVNGQVRCYGGACDTGMAYDTVNLTPRFQLARSRLPPCLNSSRPAIAQSGKRATPPPLIKKERFMKNSLLTLIVALSLGLCAGSASAAGCLKSAAVGAVAGHVAGHHAVVGALAGCAIGHHMAKEKAKTEARDRATHVAS